MPTQTPKNPPVSPPVSKPATDDVGTKSEANQKSMKFLVKLSVFFTTVVVTML